jgi:hypothetical protein
MSLPSRYFAVTGTAECIRSWGAASRKRAEAAGWRHSTVTRHVTGKALYQI